MPSPSLSVLATQQDNYITFYYITLPIQWINNGTAKVKFTRSSENGITVDTENAATALPIKSDMEDSEIIAHKFMLSSLFEFLTNPIGNPRN